MRRFHSYFKNSISFLHHDGLDRQNTFYVRPVQYSFFCSLFVLENTMQLLRKNGITWCRNFSIYAALRVIPKPKKASLTPFDKRLTVTGKHVNEHVKGGSRDMQKRVALHVVPPIGFAHPASNQFKKVKEMQPEFAVPDLTDFKLKPYVSYKATPITEPKLTARRLFNSCYAQQVESDLKEGKIK